MARIAHFDAAAGASGDMILGALLDLGLPLAALKEYELSMQATPNRLRGWYGAAKAAEAVGDQQKAAGYYGKLAQLTRNADGDRAEIREAKLKLASR